ncbi:MAG: response regulator [Bacteroidota bacterium]|nr:response regulator [Ignavibacteria bacterium]MCU7500663.1 response regulator [Ignavibacteria bacterium]MCU7512811.1 response regulator [Ignavibacteria bacterium]MCU7521778.1 response regulator [Ignavibacteria bacterium]MCU7524827.1 response regulator [Ignavibacteria bacterium]
MDTQTLIRPMEILLVEDNNGDILLIQEALEEGKLSSNLSVTKNGMEAIDFLHRRGPYKDAPTPDLILLDMNLPKKNGKEVLAEIKSDENLKVIPVVILTSSQAEQDILVSYKLNANCYITKPVDFEKFITVINSIEDFWFSIVKLPTQGK